MTAAMSAGSDTKACPFCAEDVKAVAKKCKHCGETLDVALRAAEEARRTAEGARNNPMVFMNAGGGAAVDAGPVKPQGSWLILFLLLFLFFPAAIVYWVVRRW